MQRTLEHFVRAARLARRAGYDAVEIMRSEGYLLNQFLAARTNRRTDAWGGSADRRRHLPVEVVRRVVEAVGDDLAVVYRISLVDLVEDGETWDDVLALAHELEQVGVHALGTGIGWHEARVPTILSQVPRAAWASLTARLRAHVDVPVIAANRINTPEVAEQLLADGTADLVGHPLRRRRRAGGQFRLAMRVPGKEEFAHALAAYERQLQVLGVDVRLRIPVLPADLMGYDAWSWPPASCHARSPSPATRTRGSSRTTPCWPVRWCRAHGSP